MHPTKNTLSENIRAKSVMLLGTGLIHAADLQRHAKQAHWNVKGPHFIALHELFDKVSAAANAYADLCAERMVALGGTADGRAKTVVERSTLPPYPIEATVGHAHVAALSQSLATFGALCRDSIDQAAGWGDADTADLFTEISRGIDQHLWMVEVHNEHASLA